VTVGLLRCVNNGFTMVEYISTLVPGVLSLYAFATINESGMHLLGSSMSYRMKKLKCFHAGAPGRERSSDVLGGTFDVLEATFERKGVAAFKTSTSHVCTFKRQTWSPNVRLTCKRARFRAQKGGMRRV
jgi:hypothetical protein